MGGEMGWTKVGKERMRETERGTAGMERKENREALRADTRRK